MASTQIPMSRRSPTFSTHDNTRCNGSSSVVAELHRVYQALTARMASISRRIQVKPEEYGGRNQSQLDAVTDEMQQFAARLSAIPSEKLSLLKLKATAVLLLLPDDDDPATILAGSLCRDLIEMRLVDTPNGTDI